MTTTQYRRTCSTLSIHGKRDHRVSDSATIGEVLHCVVADARSKAPVYPGWLQQPATDDQIADADSEPYLLLGHVPFGVGMLVIDVDTGRGAPASWWAEAVEESLGPPICTVRTRSGGLHLYYRTDEPVGNAKWEGGEVRCAAGHVVIWDLDALRVAVEGLDDHDLVDCSRWPISQRPQGVSASDEWEGDQGGKVGAALRLIDCREVHYDDWIAVGHALHWADHYGRVRDGLRMWTEWSATDPARFRFGECGLKWRGFDADRGRTLGTLFNIAKQHGFEVWRQSSIRRVRPPKPDGVLNDRQQSLHDLVYSQARSDRRGGVLTFSLENRRLAEFFECSRKTIERDTAHMAAEGYLKPVGKRIVRTETGGHVLQVWRPTTPDLERWQQHMTAQSESPPEPAGGCVVRFTDGGVADITAPIPVFGGGGWGFADGGLAGWS